MTRNPYRARGENEGMVLSDYSGGNKTKTEFTGFSGNHVQTTGIMFLLSGFELGFVVSIFVLE